MVDIGQYERNPDTHRFRPISRPEAVARLTRENVQAIDPRASGHAGQAFRAMGRLVRHCPAYALSASPDLAILPEQVYALLDAAVGG